MASLSGLRKEVRELALSVADDFQSSLDLVEMFTNARQGLGRLIPLDAVALCVSRPRRVAGPVEYDWMPFGLDSYFFQHYPEVAAYDFVRDSTTRAPNRVLRDSEMISRDALIRNPMYERLRELGQPIEHCMSGSLWVNDGWHGGLTLYRARRKPFSASDLALHQWLVPRLARAINHCRTYAHARTQASLLREVTARQGASILVRGVGLADWTPTPAAMRLLAQWFSPSELAGGRLPVELRTQLASLARRSGGLEEGPGEWRKRGTDKDLCVRFEPLPVMDSERSWLLLLEEKRSFLPVPESWLGRISKAEATTVALAFRFWDYETIAGHLEVKPNTVKQHVQSACTKLGVENLKKLMALALRDG
ncbi:MAG: LuxR C-terminal-related transcriptional regulator [Cystobacter sp.]